MIGFWSVYRIFELDMSAWGAFFFSSLSALKWISMYTNVAWCPNEIAQSAGTVEYTDCTSAER